MKKRAMYIILITAFLMSSSCYAKSKTSQDTPGTAIFVMAEDNPVLIDTKSFASELDEINLSIKFPQIKGLEDKKFERDLNKRFREEAQRARKEAITTAKEYNKDIIQDHLTPIKFEYISTFSVIEAPKAYLVLGFLNYQYSGGAHGISHQKYLNIRTTDHKILTLKDLFKEDADYKSLINAEINEQMKNRQIKGEYFFTGSQGFTGIKEDQEYYINTLGDIVIVFNVYEIAPYAAGIIEFTIPREKLAAYLQ